MKSYGNTVEQLKSKALNLKKINKIFIRRNRYEK